MSIIQIKRSLIAGNVPASLQDGELAINEVDEVLFYKNAAGVIRSFNLPSAPMDAMGSTGLQINGSIEIDQEHLGGTVSIPNNSATYIVDQWLATYVHTANTAVFTANRAVLNANATLGNNLGFGLRAVSSTALTSPSSGDYMNFQQPIEGYRWERLNFGVGIARPVSIGFWVFATITGTGTVSIRNSTGARSYVADFTVTAANTWQWNTVTIPGDTAGTWLTGNSIGAYISFCFAGGSIFRTAANIWTAGNFFSTPQTTNFFATNGNQVIITGALILPGTSLPPAPRMGLVLRSSDEELLRCLRYFYNGIPPARGMVNSTLTANHLGCYHPQPMRAVPTLLMTSALSVADATTASVLTSITGNFSTTQVLEFDCSFSSALTAGRPGVIDQGFGGNLNVSARM